MVNDVIPDFVGPMIYISLFITLAVIVAVLIIALSAINRNFKRQKLEHEERMLAIERGQPLPMTPAKQKRRGNYPFAWPFVLIGFGLALIIIAIIADDTEPAGFGLVSLFIGIGLFASRFYGQKKSALDSIENGSQNNNNIMVEEVSPVSTGLENRYGKPSKSQEAPPATSEPEESPKESGS